MRTKFDDVLELTKLNDRLGELVGKKEQENKPSNIILWVLAVIGAVAAVAAIAFAVYNYLTPAYEDDFDDDDFDDDFDDDLDDEDDKDSDSKN